MKRKTKARKTKARRGGSADPRKNHALRKHLNSLRGESIYLDSRDPNNEAPVGGDQP